MQRNIDVKNYINKQFVKENSEIKLARENSEKHQLPEIHIPAHVGKLISILTRLKSPKRILEIGTLGAYSTLWIASAISKDAKIICLEINPKNAEIARENIQKAGYSSQIEIHVGDAQSLLKKMNDEKRTNKKDIHSSGFEGYDLIFIDADKQNYPIYLELVLPLTKSGTLILSDNLIPKSEKINNPEESDNDVSGIYKFNRMISESPNLESIIATTIVGDKGRIDGLGITLVK